MCMFLLLVKDIAPCQPLAGAQQPLSPLGRAETAACAGPSSPVPGVGGPLCCCGGEAAPWARASVRSGKTKYRRGRAAFPGRRAVPCSVSPGLVSAVPRALASAVPRAWSAPSPRPWSAPSPRQWVFNVKLLLGLFNAIFTLLIYWEQCP